MDLMPIRDVSKTFDVSTRTLRYYEEVGLLKSTRDQDGQMRAYDAEALERLRQILALRAMRLPLKQIEVILRDESLALALTLLLQHAYRIQMEISALTEIHQAVSRFAEQLKLSGKLDVPLKQMDDTQMHKLMQTLTLPLTFSKEEPTMPQLTDVRILYLPPMTVCSIHAIGANAEEVVGPQLAKFAQDNDLARIKPDLRSFGFNHPNGEKPDGSDHGYELWISIPDDLPVNPPYIKKQFSGGLYAAHMIPMGAFEEWPMVVQWVENNDQYAPRWGDAACMAGLLEEHLNYINFIDKPHNGPDSGFQLDLLVPIQPRDPA